MSHLQLNDIGMSFIQTQKLLPPLLLDPARVLRAGVTGARLLAVAAPLTPRPRGTIYEALPFILGRV